MGITLLIVVGAALAFLAAMRALRAYLRLRRTRAALRDDLAGEVARLARRTGELEKTLSALDARAQQLPVQISELQQSLTTLGVLTGALSASLRQAQAVLSFSALKTLSSLHLSEMLRSAESRLQNRRTEASRDTTTKAPS